jgi:hypothetical protein
MPPKKSKTARVVELLQMAMEWQRQLDAGEVETRAEIARRGGITRARVTQIMAMLRLPPETQEHILAMPEWLGRPAISERALRAWIHGRGNAEANSLGSSEVGSATARRGLQDICHAGDP